MFSPLWTLIAAVACVGGGTHADRDNVERKGHYKLVDNFEGLNFFKGFEFITVTPPKTRAF